ncbi:MAG: peptidoglycan DD-metalloendopeptidase family protein [Rikenellaceae bacterium]
MRKTINYILFTLAAALQFACFSGQSTGQVEGDVEEVEVVENRRYGVLSDGYELEKWRVKSGETMGVILSRFGRSSADIFNLERASKGIYTLNKIGVGNRYTTFVKCDSLGVERLDHLAYEIDKRHYAVFSFADSIVVSMGEKETTVKRHNQTATIDSSMWLAANEVGMPDALSSEIEDIFQWTVDFFSISKGDSFTVIYDEMFVDDSVSIGLGRVWGAKFHHADRDYYAIPFKQGDRLQYWEEDGGSLRKQMLKAPLKYSRISSGFSYARLHPIYKVYKPHTGVDYAAPAGTEVHSVADGVVIFKGWGGGGGNTLKIKHPGGFTTGYLHLKGYAKNIALGSSVKQGQTIGYVGSTGASTGPHLDYRVWKGSTPINPLKLPQKPSEPIAEENRAQFDFVKERIIAELNGELEECDYITSFDNLPSFEKPQAESPNIDSMILALR